MGVVYRRAARADLVAAYRHLMREAGVAVADRFFDRAEATIGRLARRPRLGARYEGGFAALGELRSCSIDGFRSHIIFYTPVPGGIRVVRVLHGARDIDAILAEEFGVDDRGADDESG